MKLWILSLVFIAACTGSTLPPLERGPQTAIERRGDGNELAEALGVEGGRLHLGSADGLPTLSVPPGALSKDGRIIRIKRAADQPAPEGKALSISFEINPPTEAPVDLVFTISTTVAADAGCDADRLRLAIERPNDVGPADGTSSPTLRWDYDQAAQRGRRIFAPLVHIPGNRLRFVCVVKEKS